MLPPGCRQHCIDNSFPNCCARRGACPASMPQLRGSVLLLLVSTVLLLLLVSTYQFGFGSGPNRLSRELSEAGSGSGSVISEAGSGSVVSEASPPTSPPTSPPPTSSSSSGAVVASTPAYQTALDQMYAQVDLNPTDGSLSKAEYDAMDGRRLAHVVGGRARWRRRGRAARVVRGTSLLFYPPMCGSTTNTV